MVTETRNQIQQQNDNVMRWALLAVLALALLAYALYESYYNPGHYGTQSDTSAYNATGSNRTAPQ